MSSSSDARPSIDARVLLDTHPEHPSAVTATVTGPDAKAAITGLALADWEPVNTNMLVLVRIDHEEPYWARHAAQALALAGTSVEFTPRLREAVEEEWTWANHPMRWCSREGIREVSQDAQRIYDDIRRGRLRIAAHSIDRGGTTVAVGSYSPDGEAVFLHGENHLRTTARRFDSLQEALEEFTGLYGDRMQPGPAPATDTERAAEEARAPLPQPNSAHTPATSPAETPPRADALDAHDALLDAFLAEHGTWEKYRTWSDTTTHAVHEDLTLRIERVHEPEPHEAAWTVAAYESPVGKRTWHLTVSSGTPDLLVTALLDHLGNSDAYTTSLGRPADDKSVITATEPLTHAGWTYQMAGPRIRWTSPASDGGVQFDAVAAQQPQPIHPAWTLWTGPDPDRASWKITASVYTPAALLADLTTTLANRTSRAQVRGSASSLGRQAPPPARRAAGHRTL